MEWGRPGPVHQALLGGLGSGPVLKWTARTSVFF